jgi:hypothetical protein
MGQGTILRSDDLVVLGVSWSQMDPVPPEETSAPELVAVGDGARLVVTFPPQAVAEKPTDRIWWGSTWHALGGPAPPGGSVELLFEPPQRLHLLYVQDNRNAWSNPFFEGTWQSDVGEDRPAGAPFPPGGAITAVYGGLQPQAFAIDDDGRLGRNDEFLFAGDFEPLDGGSGEGSGFTPGSRVAATVVNFVTNVFAVRGTDLVHWREDLGFRVVVGVPAGARLTAFSGDRWSLVYWIAGDGQLCQGITELDGRFRSASLGNSGGTPATPVAVSGSTDAQNIYLVNPDSILWGIQATTYLAEDGQEWYALNQWAQLEGGFPADAHVASVAGVGDGGEHAVAAVDARGVAQVAVHRFDGTQIVLDSTRGLGDWFPPGGGITLASMRQSIEVAVIASDRTVRYSRREADGTWLDPPQDWQPISGFGRQPANLAHTSQIAFAVPRDDRVVLTAQGVLDAMRRLPIAPGPAAAEPSQDDNTVMDLPWGLQVSLDHAAEAVAAHRVTPRTTASGATEVWHTRVIRAPGGADAASGRLPMRALCWWLDPAFGEPFEPVLGEAERGRIVEASAQQPFFAERLLLSPIGAWATFDGAWPDLEWSHDLAGGRDKAVRTVVRGVLFPFGHEAVYDEVTKRRFDPRSDRSVAVLHRQATLRVNDSVRRLALDEQARVFPFDEVEIATPLVRIDPADWQPPTGVLAQYRFQPQRERQPVLFPVVLRNGGGEITLHLPLLFVWHVALASDAFDATLLPELQQTYGEAGRASVQPTFVKLTDQGSFEVHELEVGVRGASAPGGPRRLLPHIATAKIGLPAVRDLAKEAQSYSVSFAREYVNTGALERVFDVAAGQHIGVDFAGQADRVGGLATPSFVADAISGAGAPINAAMAAAGSFDPRTFFAEGAKLLGIVDLRAAIAHAAGAPVIKTLADGPPAATLEWTGVKLGSNSPPLRPIEGREAVLDLKVEAAAPPPGSTQPLVTTTGTLTAFCLDLAGVVVVSFRRLHFSSVAHQKPALDLSGLEVRFAGDLEFLAVLESAVEALGFEPPVAVEVTSTSVRASHHVALPPITLPAGAFSVSIRDAVFDTAVLLPFDGQVAVDLAFGSRRHPFRVGVWILGGGGYLELGIRNGTDVELAASAEIGGLWAIDWAVVVGEVHALAGIEIKLGPRGAVLSGYLRVGGTVELVGLVSVAIELSAAITAVLEPAFKVVANARLVLEVDLFLISTGVDLEKTIVIYDSASQAREVLGARGAGRELPEEDARAAWQRFRAAFEPV